MKLKDIKFFVILAGVVGFLLSTFALLYTIDYGILTNWRTVLGSVFDIIIIIGSIGVFVSAAKLQEWEMKKYYIIYIPVIVSCFAHDLVFLTLVNSFSGVIYQFILLLIYRFRKKNPLPVKASAK